ncbi:MAG: hypothetical protein WDZ83_07955 [Rhizobiaceae bacterium]
MPALALADVLKDFGAHQQSAKPVPVNEPRQQPPAEAVVVPPRVETSAADQAIEVAKQELAARLELEHTEAIDALKESHKQEIERLQAEIGERAGDTVTAGFQEMENRLVELTSSVAARILGITLTEDVSAKALDALATAIGKAARDREAVRIRIHGPLSLFEALRAKLGRYADQVEFTESTNLDVTVAIDDALFETRLSEWSSSLSEIMA